MNVANEIYKEIFIQKPKLADGQYAESTVFENVIELKEKNKEEKDYPVLSVVKEANLKHPKMYLQNKFIVRTLKIIKLFVAIK